MYKYLFIIILCFVAVTSSLAQNKPLSTDSRKAEKLYYKADDYIKSRDFERAIQTLADATKKDPEFAEAYIKAANLYKVMGNKTATFNLLQKGLSLLPYDPAQSTDYYTLAELYFDRGEYTEAKIHYENFLKGNPKNSKFVAYAKQQLKTVDFAVDAMNNPVDFKPELLPGTVNKFGVQYFPSTTADQKQFIYTARIGTRPEHDENIYISEKKDGKWLAPASISNRINSSANEGAATISGDGKTLVFTACNRPDSNGDCDLYISNRTGDEWSKPNNMGKVVNSRVWDSQPSLSADGRTLYFVSNRSGGIGLEDIWETQLNDDGTWSAPKNLGEPVNSTGRDLAPYVHVSGSTLYFVSDGHVGMGGLDVFLSNMEDKKWTEPKNLGYPLNTQADEGSLFITPDNQKGYYSRQQLRDETDARTVTIQLYSFDVPAAWKSKMTSTYAQGRVFHSETKLPIGAVVQVYDVATDSLVQQVNADKITGEYTVVLTEGNQYALYVSAPKFMLNSFSFDYSSPSNLNPVALDVYLEPIKSGSAVVLNNLFFESGEYKLQDKSKTELNRLINFLRQNKSIKIEISGHTDDVGSDKDNKVLSERRAKAVVDYLTANGVPRSILKYKGYGESKPVEPNTTEVNRQLNRRIEMQVL